MTDSVVFSAKPNSLIGGHILMTKVVSIEEFFRCYNEWRSQNPGRSDEFSYDETTMELDVGFWDIELTCSSDGLSYGIVGSEMVVEDVEQVPVEENQPATFNSVDIRGIMNPTTSLDLSRVFDKPTMVEAGNLSAMTAISTSGGVKAIEHSGIVSGNSSGGVMHQIEHKPSVANKPQATGRLNIKNSPAKQIRAGDNREQPMSSKKHRQDDDGETLQRNVPAKRRQAFDRDEDRSLPPIRSPQRLSALTGGQPANPELIAQLMQSGIGSARSNVDIGRYLNTRKERELQVRRYYDSDFVDGKTCINVSAAAETDLGKALRLSQERPFEYPGLGRFTSLTGMYLFLTESVCGNYHTISGNPANKELHQSSDYRKELQAVGDMSEHAAQNCAQGHFDFQAIYAIMGDCLWLTVNQDAELVKGLLENPLEFECYTWVKPRDLRDNEEAPLRLRHGLYGIWYLPLLREVVYTLHARLKALLDGKSAENLPVPNFTKAISGAVSRLRRKIVREIVRREIGFASVPGAPKATANNPQRSYFDSQKTSTPKNKATNTLGAHVFEGQRKVNEPVMVPQVAQQAPKAQEPLPVQMLVDGTRFDIIDDESAYGIGIPTDAEGTSAQAEGPVTIGVSFQPVGSPEAMVFNQDQVRAAVAEERPRIEVYRVTPEVLAAAQMTLADHAKIVDAEMGVEEVPVLSVEDMVQNARVLARSDVPEELIVATPAPVLQSFSTAPLTQAAPEIKEMATGTSAPA